VPRSAGGRRAGRRIAGRPLALPRWWVAAVAAFVLVVVVVVVVVVRTQVAPCRDEVDSSLPRNPLLTPEKMAEQPDDRLDQLAAAVEAMPSPFGRVTAGVGYDYDQWLHLYGIENGLVAFTKGNAPVTVIDPGSRYARWSVRPTSKRIAWDAAGQDFLLLDLSADDDTRVSAYSVADGRRLWCAQVDQTHRSGQPVATSFLDDGSVLTALPDGGKVALTRLSGTGATAWSRSYASVGRADFLGPLTSNLVLAGGTEEYRLAEQAPDSDGGPVITAIDTTDGGPAWTWRADPDSLVHVVGVDGGRAIAVERSPQGLRLFALSDTGAELWSRTPEDAAYEATLRNGVVVMKSAAALYGYDAFSGELRWKEEVPTDRTYFPYGFTLGQMPSLDEDHVLMPTTTQLVVLDVQDGSRESYPLPVDGINTTYWPYQLAVTGDAIGVVTNTGAVVAARE
jgi:outer membrane protein assembly factor BamB